MEMDMSGRLKVFWISGAILLATAFAGCSSSNLPMTQEELVRRTQELMDSYVPGNQAPFAKYFAWDSMYFDEKGRNMDKSALLQTIRPMPRGYSGSIKIVNVQSRIFIETAILSYDLDETETVFGQELRAHYHATDTWMRRKGDWQIVAGQVLRYYEDPAPGRVDASKNKDYAGTYELSPENKIVISIYGQNLYAQRTGRSKDVLVPEAESIFFRKGVEGRILFRRDSAGHVDVLIDRRNNEDIIWKKIL
jgi:hypothetical protein